MAEKEGFEPSIPFWGIHDFQSCALGQLRDFSKCNRYCGQLGYIKRFVWICQALFSTISKEIIVIIIAQIECIFYNSTKSFLAYSIILCKSKELTFLIIMDIICKLASVAQSVVHLTRNEKVACSSHVTSSKNGQSQMGLPVFEL